MQSKYSRIFLTLLSTTILIVSSISAQAQEKTSFADEVAALEQYIEGQMQLDRIPGLSIAVYYDDFVWARGFGFSDLENRVPSSEKTMYRWASVGKPMTATGIVKLATDGKLDLDDEARTYVPYFPEKPWPILIRQLLGHIGGISHYRDYSKEGHFKAHYTTEQSIGVFKDWDLVAEPGSRYNYSSYGYNLLGAVIEGASGMSYTDYMTQYVWEPLGMFDTRMDDPDDIIQHRTRGYRLFEGKIINSEFIDISSRFGAGGTRTTVLDIVAFARGLDEGKVLSHEQQAQMFDSMYLADGTETGYGMGWGVGTLQGTFSLGHSGGQAETSTYLIRVPRKHFAVAVACNLEDSPAGNYARVTAALFLDAFRISVEAKAAADQAVLPMTIDMWNRGTAYFERHGSALTDDPQKLAEAFAAINKLLSGDAGNDTRAQYLQAESPASGHMITAVSSYIAGRLREVKGSESFSHYQHWQPFDFFADYIALYKSGSSIPQTLRFNATFEGRITDWQAQWRNVWTDEMRRFLTLPDSELGSVALRLREITKDASIYPRFNNRINTQAYRLKSRGRTREGLALLEIAADLYPSDANLLDSMGEFHLELGNRQRAVELYRAALAKNPGFLNARYILAKLQPAEVSEEMLASYTGAYLLGDMEIGIEIEENHLVAVVPGEGRVPLYPEKEDTFISREPDGNVVIVKFIKSSESVQSMEVTFPDSTVQARKIR